jgi:ABC-type Fe2+-enterobactin transport system substrate-binding protein
VGHKRTGSAAFGSQTNQKALLLWRLGRQMTRIPEERWQVASGKWQNDISVISKEWLPA